MRFLVLLVILCHLQLTQVVMLESLRNAFSSSVSKLCVCDSWRHVGRWRICWIQILIDNLSQQKFASLIFCLLSYFAFCCCCCCCKVSCSPSWSQTPCKPKDDLKLLVLLLLPPRCCMGCQLCSTTPSLQAWFQKLIERRKSLKRTRLR